MPTCFLAPIGTPTQQFFTDQGVILSGGLIYTYQAGTTTPIATYTTSSGGVSNPNPIQLDSAGRPPQEIWLQEGVQYKFVITDANNNPLAVSSFDNLTGIGDTSFSGGGGSNSASEWVVSSLTPTYVSGTQFSVPGNQTTTFSPNRRVEATVTAGTIYGTITTSSFSGSNTTVTVVWDSGTLDNGLSSVSYGLLNPTNPSYLSLVNIQTVTTTGALACSNGATRARVRMTGGGGAGGGTTVTSSSSQSVAGGGASADYIEFWVSSGWQSLNGTELTIGAAGTPATGTTGGNGGNTTFGSLATANGGVGGNGGGTQSYPYTATDLLALPGTNSNSPSTTSPLIPITLLTGPSGFPSVWWGGDFLSIVQPGNGGSNPLGNGGNGVFFNPFTVNHVGIAGTGYGSGGSGAISLGSNSSQLAGGSGAPGIMIIEEYL